MSSVVVGLLLLLSACTEKAQVNYRLSIEADEAGAIRTGSGVWSSGIVRTSTILGPSYSAYFKGEAIPISLSGGRMLFYVPAAYPPGGPGNAATLPDRLFLDVAIKNHALGRVQRLRLLSSLVGQRRAIPCPDYSATKPDAGPDDSFCMMLAFSARPSDPKAFEGVGKGATIKAGGTSLTIRRVTVEITDAPATTGITAILPWMVERRSFAQGMDTIRLQQMHFPPQLMYMKRGSNDH